MTGFKKSSAIIEIPIIVILLFPNKNLDNRGNTTIDGIFYWSRYCEITVIEIPIYQRPPIILYLYFLQGIPVLLPISLDKLRILGIPSEEEDGQAYCSLKMLKSSILQMLEFKKDVNDPFRRIFVKCKYLLFFWAFFPFLGRYTRKRRIWSTRMSGNGSERILAGHPLGRICWELQLFPVCLLLSANIM